MLVLSMNARETIQVADLIRESQGQLDRNAIYYMIKKGWLTPTRIAKQKIERFEFGENDLRLVRAIGGYTKLGFSRKRAIQSAIDDIKSGKVTLDCSPAEDPELKQWLMRLKTPRYLPVSDDFPILASPTHSHSPLTAEFAVDYFQSPETVFKVAYWMISLIRQQDISVVIELDRESLIIIGALLTYAHFERYRLFKLSASERNLQSGWLDDKVTPQDKIAIVGSYASSMDEIIQRHTNLEKYKQQTHDIILVLDALRDDDRKKINKLGLHVWSYCECDNIK